MNAFWLRFAARTLLRRRARSGVTLGAIAIGVGSLIFLAALMVGVNDAMIANSVSLSTGHALVRSDDAAGLAARWRDRKDLPAEVAAALPRLSVPAMLVGPAGAAPVQLVGVLPERERAATAIPARVQQGRYLDAAAGQAEILLGARTAQALGASVGQAIRIRMADGTETRAEAVGIFRTGVDRFDEGIAYAPLDRVRALGHGGLRGEVAVFLRHPLGRDAAAALLRPLLAPGEEATPWEDLLPELEQLTRLNVVSMAIVMALVVVMMAAGVSNTVLVSVMDRYREFGVLKALGATPGEIVRLILVETSLLCLAAGAAGLGLGALAAGLFGHTGLDLARFTSENPHFVLTSVVYPRLTAAMAVGPALAVLAAGILVSLWPGLVAARRRAADVMRLSR